MKRVLMTALVATASIAIASPASAAVTLVDHGITYQLDLNSITNGGLTGNFALAISGINTGSDTEGGRTGINGFSFNGAPFAVSGVSSGFTFQLGGLNSGGCNGSGAGFFCFKDTSFVFPSPLPSAGSLFFSVTSNTTGSWDNWAPSFKIDWTGTANNYDLVSKDIGLNNCTREGCPVPTQFGNDPVPEPATWAMMLLGFGGIGMAMRRGRKANGRLLQLA